MSQFFDLASMVLVPSGYKSQKIYSQKPLSTDGELTFSRASNATRVNSSGLVEKVRENLVLYSQEFDNAYWSKANGGTGVVPVVTANTTAAPDGTTTADTIVFNVGAGTTTSDQTFVNRVVTATVGQEYGSSIYLKGSVGGEQIVMRLASNTYALITLTTSWQRFEATAVAVATGWSYEFGIRQGLSGIGTINSTATIYAWGAQLETGVPTDYIATTSSAVSVGPVSGLPRLDYSGGCPSLLLEPQRTNLVAYSEQFGQWANNNFTLTENFATSPDGYQNADKFAWDASTDSSAYRSVSGSSAVYSISIFAKYVSGGKYLYIFSPTNYEGAKVWFDIEAGTVSNEESGFTGAIQNYGNGWFRCTLTNTSNKSLDYFQFGVSSTSTSRTLSTASVSYFWGAMVEQGSYSSSYLPTLSTAVTRVEDNTLTSGLSGSLPQTAGTLFWDIEYTFGASSTMLMHNTGVSDYAFCQVSAGGLVEGGIYESGTMVERLVKSGAIATGRHKLAFAYATNSFALYVDGVLADSGTSGSTASISMNTISLDWNSTDFTRVNQVLLFQTRLSNADLATLTSL